MPKNWVAYGNEELGAHVKQGDVIRCPKCGGVHQIECALDEQKQPTNLLMFYKCDTQPDQPAYLGAVAGRLIPGVVRAPAS